MSTGQIIIGIFAFAVVTALLYVWGLKKSFSQAEELEKILLSKGASRVIKYLKHHGVIDQKEIANQVRGLKAGMFWSKKRVEVQNPSEFAKRLEKFMLDQQLLEKTEGNRYRRKDY